MLIKTIGTAVLGALVLTAPLAANAQSKHDYLGFGLHHTKFGAKHGAVYTPGINRRIRRQNRRINRGRRLGDLTRFEYRKLKFKLFQIRMARRYAKIDGHVSRGERRRIHRMLDRNSRRIFRLRHNDRYAGDFRGRPAL